MFSIRNRRKPVKSAPGNSHLPLTRMRNGQSGKVIQVAGGLNIPERLAALGIRPGQQVTRIGGMFLRGPITIKVEKTQVAIGFGMARKITIEPEA